MGDKEELPIKPFSLKTLMPGWQYFAMAYPKDYDAYASDKQSGGKNLFYSSYKRFGVDEDSWETEKMASRLDFSKVKANERSQRRPLINMLTYHTTEGELREKFSNRIGITEITDEAEIMELTTTMTSDYTAPYPYEEKVCDEECMRPETKFRRLIVESLNIRRPGLGKFYDEGMEYLDVKRRPIDPPPFKINLV